MAIHIFYQSFIFIIISTGIWQCQSFLILNRGPVRRFDTRILHSRADATTFPCKPGNFTAKITTSPYKYPTEADASIIWSDELTTRNVFRSVGVCKLCRLKCDCACVQRTCVDTSCCGSEGTVTASTSTTNSTPS